MTKRRREGILPFKVVATVAEILAKLCQSLIFGLNHLLDRLSKGVLGFLLREVDYYFSWGLLPLPFG